MPRLFPASHVLGATLAVVLMDTQSLLAASRRFHFRSWWFRRRFHTQ